MRTRNLIGLGVAATAACYLFIERSQTNGIVGFYRDTLSAPMFACWFAGFFLATISAPTCAAFFWLLANRSRYGWILHVVLVPTIYILVRASAALMLFASSEPSLEALSGRAILPAMVLLIICPIAYYVALGTRKIGKLRQFAKGY